MERGIEHLFRRVPPPQQVKSIRRLGADGTATNSLLGIRALATQLHQNSQLQAAVAADSSTNDDSVRWPNFFLIGAMKSGSTSLASHLQRCPSIVMAHPKEPQYFSGGRYAQLGTLAYSSLFAEAAPGQLCGEASTCYSRYPHHGDVPALIHRRCPSAKFIYLLRDPVDRVYSHYLHDMQERWAAGRELPKAFTDAWQNDPEYLDASRYAFQLRRFHQYFDPDRFLLCHTDDLRDDPDSLVHRICGFLGAEPPTLPVEAGLQANRSLGTTFQSEAGGRAFRGIRRSGLGRCVAGCVPKRIRRHLGVWTRSFTSKTLGALELNALRQQVSPMQPGDRAELLDVLRPSIMELQDYWHRDLSSWLDEGGSHAHGMSLVHPPQVRALSRGAADDETTGDRRTAA